MAYLTFSLRVHGNIYTSTLYILEGTKQDAIRTNFFMNRIYIEVKIYPEIDRNRENVNTVLVRPIK